MDCIYKNSNALIEDRVKDLLSRMTLQEKIGQMTQIERSVATPSALKDLSIGSILSAGGSGPFEEALSSDWADMVDKFQQSALESRLGIPLIYGIDAVHGNNSVYGATIFPHNVSLGATRFAGTTTSATPKGLPFCSWEGVSTVMASYSSWNGHKLHADQFLLTEILKDKLGFKGFVISDWEALDQLCEPQGSNYRYCISTAVNAGIDMVMVPHRYKQFMEDLTFLVESGKVQMSRIDDAVERILRVKFVSGLFEYPFSDRSLLDIVGCKLHRELAQEAVRKSLVLLKNGKNPENPFLPLDRCAKRILVAGTHADNLGYQCGGWTGTWHGGSGKITIGTTILDAIRESVGDETEVIYDQYPSPNTLAGQNFSFAIVVVGEPPYAENLGDNEELVIPFNGSDIISSVADRIPTLAILISGRPLVLEPSVLEKVDALVAAWLPGSEGQGITDVIFGDFEFEGRLPMTWFRSVEQLPMNAGHYSYDPLFPLGFGLTCNKEKPLE
ncbi:lysosomal beta glucosidase-like isoform X2 [Durio zibethinus]|uniref:Lysosomal beta glucosidase-like isoform X2 n=1 Tax=Durio zibethinus TaxID=66656 RepID=A0A6P5ZTU6_DURZI|nr:lysosomal beta glucosidase-like isoform X2 [Durio zibethinus]